MTLRISEDLSITESRRAPTILRYHRVAIHHLSHQWNMQQTTIARATTSSALSINRSHRPQGPHRPSKEICAALPRPWHDNNISGFLVHYCTLNSCILITCCFYLCRCRLGDSTSLTTDVLLYHRSTLFSGFSFFHFTRIFPVTTLRDLHRGL